MVLRRLVLISSALLLAACNSVSNFNPLTAGKPVVDISQLATQKSVYCPKIEIRRGTQTINSYAEGLEGDPLGLEYQARIVKTARECTIANGQLNMRIGINGRVLGGPKAGERTVNLPIRVAVVKFQEGVLASELYPFVVQISDFDRTPDFVNVVDIAVPDPTPDRDLIIYLGFDVTDDA